MEISFQAPILGIRIPKARTQQVAKWNRANLFFECCGKSALWMPELRPIGRFNDFCRAYSYSVNDVYGVIMLLIDGN
jgi:hypothetical protein